MVNSRRKGKRGELQAAALINSLFPQAAARRAQQYKGTAESADLIHELSGVHIEVKNREAWSVLPWLEKLAGERDLKSVGLLLMKKNNKPWVVTLYAKELPQLIRLLTEDCNVRCHRTDT